MILALDLATRTGFAVGNGAGISNVGTWDVAPRRGDSPGMRFAYLRGKLERMREAYPEIALVTFEQAHHRGGAATAIAAGLAAVVLEWCAVHGIQHTAVHSATLKKHATGKGNSAKGAMIAAAEARGWNPENDHEADALWLLDYTWKELAA